LCGIAFFFGENNFKREGIFVAGRKDLRRGTTDAYFIGHNRLGFDGIKQ
jgi:hypothetical protein